MDIHLKVWRQPSSEAEGKLERYEATDVAPEMSFLEMLDVVNEGLTKSGAEPIAFAHDCREGICGSCGVVVNGEPHGPQKATTACQLHMRSFKDGDEIVIEPWRAAAFPVIKDLIVDRSAFDRIIQAGGYISVNTGSAPEANSILIGKEEADRAMDVAQCIGCGACVAACPNASASLFTAAKITQFAVLPQGQPERWQRVVDMVAAMDENHFGHCTNIGECEEACPKGISISAIAHMNRDFRKATIMGIKSRHRE